LDKLVKREIMKLRFMSDLNMQPSNHTFGGCLERREK